MTAGSTRASSRLAIPDVPSDPAGAEILSELAARGAPILNIHRVSALAPALAKKQGPYVFALRTDCAVPRVLAELAILRVATELDCDYVFEQHVLLARRLGIREERISAIRARRLDLFDGVERAVLAFAGHAVPAGHVPQPVFDDLRAHLSDREIVELTMIIGQYSASSIFVNALGIRPEEELGAKL